MASGYDVFAYKLTSTEQKKVKVVRNVRYLIVVVGVMVAVAANHSSNAIATKKKKKKTFNRIIVLSGDGVVKQKTNKKQTKKPFVRFILESKLHKFLTILHMQVCI